MYMVKIEKLGYDSKMKYDFPFFIQCCYCSKNVKLSTVALNNIDDYGPMNPGCFVHEISSNFDLDMFGGVLPFDVFACAIYKCSDCDQLTYLLFIDASLEDKEEGPPPFRILRKEDLN